MIVFGLVEAAEVRQDCAPVGPRPRLSQFVTGGEEPDCLAVILDGLGQLAGTHTQPRQVADDPRSP